MNLQICPGDHGDPIIVKNKLIGFAIYDDSCDKKSNRPTTFISIEHFYKWIKQEVGKKNFTEAVKGAYPKNSPNLLFHSIFL